jgi:hypothetical protein
MAPLVAAARWDSIRDGGGGRREQEAAPLDPRRRWREPAVPAPAPGAGARSRTAPTPPWELLRPSSVRRRRRGAAVGRAGELRARALHWGEEEAPGGAAAGAGRGERETRVERMGRERGAGG